MPETTPPSIAEAAPPTLDHLIGQPLVKERIRVALEAAWADGAAVSHSLLVGPPGTGKTLAATIIAKEMGGRVHECLAQNLATAADMAAVLLDAGDRDCIFLDELHELPPANQVLLYRAMEEGKLFVPGRNSRRPHALPLSRITVLGATTEEWAIQPPLLQRFRTVLRFQTYTVDALTELLRQRVAALRWSVDQTVLPQIAARSKGTPRLALRLLQSTYQTARAEGETTLTAQHFERTCRLEEIDPIGLDALEQRLLRVLEDVGAPVRLNVVASRLNLPPRTISQVVERFLITEGLIAKSGEGRELTERGREHLRSTRKSVVST